MASIMIEATPKAPIAAPGTKSTIHPVYEDQFRPGKWTTHFPERLGPPVEDAESAQHALVVRYKLSSRPDRNLDLHSIVVQSPVLKKILAGVFEGYPGITSELERLEFNAPFESFVHRWDKLTAVRNELARQTDVAPLVESIGRHDTITHLELLYGTLLEELGPVLRDNEDQLKHGVMKFGQIWTLFEPDSLLYCKKDDQARIYKLKTAKYEATSGGGRTYKLDCQFVDFDGTNFGWSKETLFIAAFPGTKKITKFEVYPVAFHEDADGLKENLARRGRMFEVYKGYHFVGYDGIAHGRANRGDTKFNVHSRIIIDAHAYSRYNTKLQLELFEVASEPEEAADPTTPGEETDDDTILVDKDVGKKVVPEVGKRPVLDDTFKSVLTEEQLLLAVPFVRGYSLRDKKWFSFFVDSVRDIVWNDFAFDSLVAPREQKDLILAFAQSQVKHREHFDDFIQGKGKGIIMLLTGPPGVGKTLTAESVAEAMKAPLYSIGAADLGSKPNALENKLNDILEMCAKWNAVLLLDEADVFMEARSTADLDRNKLVSIFLRLLEYFEGIMFLTTNRVENLDAAFESRIHLTLQYHELDKASRRQIWGTFLDRSSQTRNSNVGAFSDAELDRLAKVPLNGRQIKNVLKTAQLLASKYDECLGMGHLETVLRLRKANEKRGVSFLSSE